MKKVLLIAAFAFSSTIAFSQTQRIAHRSHSGTDHHFILMPGTDNFGLPSPDTAKKTRSRSIPKKDTMKTRPVVDTMPTIPPANGYSRAVSHSKELYYPLLAAKTVLF